MVKVLVLVLTFSLFLFAQEAPEDTNASVEVVEYESPLIQKIKAFVNEESFVKNKDFIKLIFSPESDYYRQERVDVVKIVATLKENGLLNLFFDKPQELELSFKTSGAPLFFVKIMGDALRNIGYYRYVTSQSNLDASEFTWTIVLNAEYATDPLILQEELQKSGCSVVDVVKNTPTKWEYSINMHEAYLNLPKLVSGEEFIIKRSLYAHWLDVSSIQNLRVRSSYKDNWYPHITYYDQQLHLIKVVKKDKKTRRASFFIPKDAKYMKISDIYTLKNVREDLTLMPSGSR